MSRDRTESLATRTLTKGVPVMNAVVIARTTVKTRMIVDAMTAVRSEFQWHLKLTPRTRSLYQVSVQAKSERASEK